MPEDMPKNMRKACSLPVKIAAALLALTASAAAQDYPSKPVRLIIPFPPGGSNDVVGRMVALQLGDRLGKQVVVDNRGGAGGIIGSEAAAKSAPDGYTLLIISIAHAVSPWLYKLQYDPIKSFTPVAILASGPNVLVVNPSLPVHSVTELIALAKQKPGELNYASAGIGSFQHLGGELFKLTAGVNIVHVPYKGGGPAMTDVLGGYTKIMFSSLVQTTPFVLNGQLRALGTSGVKRNPALPDVPTIAEAGLPGYEATNWWGVVAPAGTPAAIVDKLHSEIAAVQNSPETKKQFAAQGADIVQMTSGEFGTFMEKEMTKWGRVVKESGMKAE
jgi:tripartite-type tricarboxylate transporter receptor subunit TctC